MEENREEIIETKSQKKSFLKGLGLGILGSLMGMILILTIVVVSLGKMFSNMGIEGFQLSKLKYITSIIQHYYYDDIDSEKLGEGIYKGLMAGLEDPYSVYYTKEEYEDMMIDTSGNYAGIGAVLSKDVTTGQVTVVSVYDDTPAQKAGLQTGDVIVSADGHRGESLDLDVFVRYIRGEEGTKVVLEYQREGENQVVEVTRAKVSVTSVKYEMLPDQIGYIAIADFSENTAEQFEKALQELQAQGMKSVIFDLRTNGGGLVDSVVEILDMILPEGITVYMEDKQGERTNYTSDGEHFLDMPMVVLTSEHTASAAEIFAGAIRDFEYGTLVGTKTYGKGIVQTTLPLNDGSAVKITFASYFTPKGECIHKKGITPDVELEYTFMGAEDEEYEISLDNQIQKACEILNQ